MHNLVGTRLSAPVQTGPGVHPSSCTMDIACYSRNKATGTWPWPPTPI